VKTIVVSKLPCPKGRAGSIPAGSTIFLYYSLDFLEKLSDDINVG